MKGYNLPDNVSPSDPEAPWNEEGEDQWEPIFTCQVCGKSITEKTGAGTENGLICIPCAVAHDEETF